MLEAEVLWPWLAAFALTSIVEAPIYAHAWRRSKRGALRWPLALAGGLVPSTVTHPIVWFAFPRWMAEFDYLPMVLAAECFAVVVEAMILHRAGVERPLMWAVLANAASVAVGLSLRATTGWV